MPDIEATAHAFFDACETGKGWDTCKDWCHENASFSSQAEPIAEMTTLAEYVEWMKGLLTPVPDGRYEIKSFAVDKERNSVCGFAVFSGTNSAEGGPVPPTGKSVAADYVYIMDFDGDKIRHMTKVWNAGWSLRELGWA